MSGILMGMVAAQGGVVQAPTETSSSTAAGSGSSTASIAFQSDGTVTASHTGLSGSSSVYPWYTSAPIVGIGAGYWISINGGAWTSLTNPVGDSHAGTNSSVSHPYQIATDSGGVHIAASGTINLSVSNGL